MSSPDITAGLEAKLAQFRATHHPQCAEVRGHRWEYFLSAPSGPPVLILPGLIGSAEMSFELVLGLQDAFQVLVPSYPVSIQTIQELVRTLAGLLDRLDLPRVNVLGGSFGGEVAQRLVRAYPERVERLILSHTGAPRPERGAAIRRFMLVLRLFPVNWMRRGLRRVSSRALSDAPAQRDFWETYSNEGIARLSKADVLARYRVAEDFDRTSRFSPDDLKDWPGRILILEGEDDPIAETGTRQALKDLYPQAHVHTFHGAGHVASIARVEEYLQVVRTFLSEP